MQATENSALQNTDEVWANLNVPVATIGGQQQVSRQLLERGAGMDAIIYQDLVKAWAANLDTQVLSGTGSSGQMLGILSTSGIGAATAFGAAATVANVNLKIAGGLASVFGAGARHPGPRAHHEPAPLGMVPRPGRQRLAVRSSWRTTWRTSTPLRSSPRPAPTRRTTARSSSGTHSSGLPILVDPNVPTAVGTNSEDIVIVADNAELHLWEDGAPKELRFEQTLGGSLTTTLAVYGYAAFTAGRYPTAVAKVGGLDASAGNGLIAPAF
jgi:hypothetical protein